MYGGKEEIVKTQEKHIELAHEMISKICEFAPEEQNEIIKVIYDQVFENRQARIDDAEKQFIHLKDTLARLQGNENQ